MAYKVAIVGAGGIAVSHLEALRRMERLTAVALADISRERADSVAAEYGISAYTDYKEMIEREKPDIAVVTLPHFLHKEASLFAAARGCHVMLEKPMALNAAECDEIIEAVRIAGVRLMVGHTQHYIAHNRAAKAIIEAGTLGTLVMINDVRHVPYYRDTRPAWFFEKAKAGGGIFMNLGSHSVDKIQWLTGSRIAQVKASVSHYGTKGDIEGSGIAWLRTESGIPATISQSGYTVVPRNETELIFTGGMLKLATSQGLWISEDGKYVEVPVSKEAPPFVLQYRDLIRYIEDGVEPSSSMEYSRSVVAVVESMYRSSETGAEQRV
ncbi:Gfo/Idh/MocA family oxidoreductase [Paenibacillus hemerocallicola]|uniref:Gfo/Idh/MocA family oxidoreductase n=1 Tax=Paenibacillus hemerocallicola TaxID=1172614 RepID=A0A5C4TCY0_9BACL|nr:Gfo/Idh/MocA family oxidoreductase [Paenibacillus hemerocallicola]TNJ66732.1 Gfo/Idh/MocA family oxidoreductase [Paenibacillus hemerocallicola]